MKSIKFKIKSILTDQAINEFWNFVKKTSLEVEKWPKWKQKIVSDIINGKYNK